MGERIVFAITAVGALGFSGLVITLRQPFRATVSLIGALLSVAVMFVLLAAPFAAAIQVIVYAGAIVVLFLFVIAYLGERPLAAAADRLAGYGVLAWIAVSVLAGQAVIILLTSSLTGLRSNPPSSDDIGSPRAIGRAFLDDYIVPFEATSLVLLIAAVGAVLLAKRAVQLERGR